MPTSLVLDSVVQRYIEARNQAYELQRRLKAKKEQLDMLEQTHFLAYEKAQLWQTKASDKYGRKAEFTALLLANPEVQKLKEQVESLEDRYQAAETQLSTMRFSQRERQIQNMQQLENSLGRFQRAVSAFSQAVEQFKQP